MIVPLAMAVPITWLVYQGGVLMGLS